MAIVPIHKAITREVLEDLSFSRNAIEIAVEANAAVDLHQGDDARETNLHAMRGYIVVSEPGIGKLNVRVKPDDSTDGTTGPEGTGFGVPLGSGSSRPADAPLRLGLLEFTPDHFADTSQNVRMQTRDETRAAVDDLLRKAIAEIVQLISKKDYSTALERLGAAMHTVQDRVFHHFEPWPYKDIPDSLMKSPDYMVCHALRDVGYISKIQVDEHQFALGVAMRVGSQSYLGADAFAPTGNQNNMSGFRGYGGMVSITIGAAPGSLRTSPGAGEPTSSGDVEPCLATEGVADKAKATDDSMDFVKQVKREVDAKVPGKWEDFSRLRK